MTTTTKIAILDDYQHAALELADWSSLGAAIDVFDTTTNDEDALVQRLEPYSVICTMRERTKLRESLLKRLPNLKLITTTGMRNAGIDVKAASTLGIVVTGTTGGGPSTVEHNWALIMAVVRHIVREHNNTENGSARWQSVIPTQLHGKTLGIIGLGRLGIPTAQIAKAFGMRVLSWSPHLTRERTDEAGVDFAETKSQLFTESDVISIHMVLSPSTTNLVTASDLALMKPTAFLVNTSRGPIVNESDLVTALREKKIAGAGLDVFNVEPLPLDHPLRKLENVTLSPHLGYVSDTSYKSWWPQTVENIRGFLDGSPVRVIDP